MACSNPVLCKPNPLQTTNIYRWWTWTLASMMVKNAGEDGEAREIDFWVLWSHKRWLQFDHVQWFVSCNTSGKTSYMHLKRWHLFFLLYQYICYSPFQMPNTHFTSIMSIMHCTSIEIYKYILIFPWKIYIYIYTAFLGATIVRCF